jgi:hypothetical protein
MGIGIKPVYVIIGIMGIYSDGNVYGVRLRQYQICPAEEPDLLLHIPDMTHCCSQCLHTFERIYPSKMTVQQIAEIKEQYDLLNRDDMWIVVSFYTSCTDTYDDTGESYMCWWPGDTDRLKELFLNGDTCI